MPTRRSVTLITLLCLLAAVAAAFPFDVGIHIPIAFNSIVTLAAISRFGMKAAAPVALCAALAGYVFTDYDHLVFVFLLEAAVVSLLTAVRRMRLFMADGLFWLFVGAPFLVVFLSRTSDVADGHHLALMVFSLVLFGLFNAGVASTIFLFDVIALPGTRKNVDMPSAVSAALVWAIILPMVFVTVIHIDQTGKQLASAHLMEMDAQYERTGAALSNYIDRRRGEMRGIVQALRGTPYDALPAIQTSLPSVIGLAVIDGSGGLIESAGNVDVLFDRRNDMHLYPRLRHDLLRKNTDGFTVRLIRSQNGETHIFIGMIMGADILVGLLDVDRMRLVISPPAPYALTIADSTGRVFIASSTLMPHYSYMDTDNHVFVNRFGLPIHTPCHRGDAGLMHPDSTIHRQGFVGPSGFLVALDIPAHRFHEAYGKDILGELTFLTITILLGLAFAMIATRGLTRSLGRVATVASHMGERLSAGIGTVWPPSRISEVDRLSTIFSEMEEELARKYEALAKVNHTLNLRVEEQTTQLRNVIKRLEREITERSKAEDASTAALVQADHERARLMSLINAMGDGVIVQDRLHRVVYQNTAMQRMVGDIVGRQATELYRDEEIDVNELPMAMAFNGRETYRTVREIGTRRGVRYFDITASPVMDADEVVASGVEIYRDITDQVQVLNELALSNDRFTVIMEALDSIVFVMKPDTGEIVFANESMISQKGDVVGRRAEEVFACAADADARSLFDETGKPLEGRTFEQRIGESEWAICYQRGMYWTDGSPVIITIATDISGLKRAEAELADKSAALERANVELSEKMKVEQEVSRNREVLLMQQSKLAAIGEMTGAIAHQWKQPLNALSIFIQSLSEAYRAGELTEEYIEDTTKRCLDQIEYMSHTVDDFRAFLRGDRTPRHFDVVGALRSISSLLSAQMKSADVTLTLACGREADAAEGAMKGGVHDAMCTKTPACRAHCETGVMSAFGVENEFKQVMLNIINNAKDAVSSSDGDGHPKGRIDVCVVPGGQDVVITVSDTGGGIPEEAVGHIFEAHYSTKGEAGTGIGLHIARIIIEEHMQGSISVQNTDEGACFTIRIPHDPSEPVSG